MRWALPLVMVAGAAWADCPTAADLATGIRVSEPTGDFSVYRDIGDDVVEVAITFDGAHTATNQLLHGVYVLRLTSVFDGSLVLDSVIGTSYDLPPHKMPLPVAGGRATFDARSVSVDGVIPEKQTHLWGPETQVGIGGCSYRGIAGNLTYETAVGAASETVLYLPELGLGLLTSFTDDAGTQTFEFSGIEAVK